MSENNLFRETDFHGEFCFESYGVKVKIQSNNAVLLDDVKGVVHEALVGQAVIIENSGFDPIYYFELSMDLAGECFLHQNGAYVTHGHPDRRFLKFFNSILRIAVAESAVSRVFIHAGVVSWRERAIVIPADSFKGKSTLVAELVRKGATYYSDEYAVVDENGLVHPFARKLSLRLSGKTVVEKEVSAERLGGRIGAKPVEIGLVLFTEYQPDAVWEPEILSPLRGVMSVIPHAIPVRANPEFTLRILKGATRNAVFVRSGRGEAKCFAELILKFFDNCNF